QQDMYAVNGVSFYWTTPWSAHPSATTFTTGYPQDKWLGGSSRSQKMYTSWTSRDSWTVGAGLFGTFMDITSGNSGGCVFFYSSAAPAPQCMGIITAQFPGYNMGRKWDSTLYSHMYNNTPFPY